MQEYNKYLFCGWWVQGPAHQTFKTGVSNKFIRLKATYNRFIKIGTTLRLSLSPWSVSLLVLRE